MKVKSLTLSTVLFSVALSISAAFGADQIPPCMVKTQVLPVNNEQVLQWKTTTDNQFTARGHVVGSVTQVFPDRNHHNHFEIKIGKNSSDVIEVVYSQDFGSLPNIVPGMNIEACGDYITSSGPTPAYPASPSGALVHWVHRSNGKHENGYVVINGKLYGYGHGALGSGNDLDFETAPEEYSPEEPLPVELGQ